MRRLICILLAAAACFAGQSEKMTLPQELQAEELPWFAFTAKNERGAYNGIINRDNLKEIAKQKNCSRVAFAFFATWCVPCREGLKRLGENAEKLKKGGVLVVMVNVAEKDLDNYSYAKVEDWAKQYFKEGWLLGFNIYSNSLEKFGLKKPGSSDTPLPRTLVTDANMKPLMLIGAEGDDYLPLLLGE